MVGDIPRQRRRINLDAYVFAVLTLISFSVLLFSTRSFMEFRDMGLSMYSGLRGSIYGVSSFVSRTVLSIRELATLKEEYAELTERMARYEQLERNAADIRRENSRLKEQLGFSQGLVYRHTAAEIIGHDPDNLFSSFVINKGKKHGIASNMPVVAYQNGGETLVGKVVQTAQLESLVMPLYDPGSFVSSRLSESRLEGIVEGQGSPELPLLMRFTRRRSRGEISIGEPVVTSGLGGVYPAGINLGRVGRILYQDNNTSIEIEVESSADFSRLEYVFVIDSFSAASGETSQPENPPEEEQGS
ncbi:MAG: rod shape-determining protein MreC [Treponema sp.]|jgi:rod shape-determining protein MreC|nr:rod shape-determining protein MreC [Treponema sp.]